MILTRKFMIVAGEASGDGHAAKLIRALREIDPEVEIEAFGSAGPRMRDAGVEAVVRADGLSIVGLSEIARSLPMFLRAFRDLKRAAEARRPDAVILVDFPDFNLKLAKTLKKKGFTVICYISPQLWAWRKYRISTIKKYVDLLITILPFEKAWYAANGVDNVEYVGSPLAREVQVSTEKDVLCEEFGLDPACPIVALLPGSRHKEIVRVLPVMLDAAARLAERDPAVQFVIAAADKGSSLDIETILKHDAVELPNVHVIQSRTYDVLNAADAAAVTSGTATLETGIIGTPMVIVYKTSKLNYRLLEPMIAVPHYGLINLIAGDRVAAELIQEEFTADSLEAELSRLLSPEVNAAMRQRLKMAADGLGHGGASKRAAQAILDTIAHPRY